MQKALKAISTQARQPQRGRGRATDREAEINQIVGQNIRTLRAMAGISQEVLANNLGITFQQVQKYEKGLNRVSAPKLVMMAEIFKTPVTTFFSNTGLPLPNDALALPAFGKKGIRAAQLVDAMPPSVQDTALKVLHSLGGADE